MNALKKTSLVKQSKYISTTSLQSYQFTVLLIEKIKISFQYIPYQTFREIRWMLWDFSQKHNSISSIILFFINIQSIVPSTLRIKARPELLFQVQNTSVTSTELYCYLIQVSNSFGQRNRVILCSRLKEAHTIVIHALLQKTSSTVVDDIYFAVLPLL